MGKKKAFIKQNEGLKFSLIHRSQKDPLIADSSTGERILAPIPKNKKKEEQVKYGIYYDNDYDYLQHLKDRNEVVGDDIEDRAVITIPKDAIRLPSTIFETKGIELKVGLLNQAAPSNSLNFNVDPEVAALLEGEEDFDELEDDFMDLANAGEGELMDDEDYGDGNMMDEKAGRANIMERFGLVRERFSDESSGDDDEEEDDFEDSDHGAQQYGIGKRNKLTEMMTSGSISSSIMPRSEGLRNIDEHFDKICEEYDDEHIGYGASDEENSDEEEEGEEELTREEWKKRLEEMEGSRKIRFEDLQLPSEEIKVKTLLMAAKNEKQPEMMERVTLDQSRKRNHWDCESILSTYSTAYNHPTVIREPSKKKMGITKKDLNEIDSMDIDKVSVISGASVSTFRPKGETAEERRLRKQGIKEAQRDRRMEKKMNKLAFKEEKRIMDKQSSRIQVKGRSIK
uniref:Protein LTV1 homolog n=1 Tax=Panagrolaimus sp. ES5 TaxID=591445 RepID=A0AC34FQN1_9BILA